MQAGKKTKVPAIKSVGHKPQFLIFNFDNPENNLKDLLNIDHLPLRHLDENNEWTYLEADFNAERMLILVNFNFDLIDFDLWISKISSPEHQKKYIGLRLELSSLLKFLSSSKLTVHTRNILTQLLSSRIEFIHQAIYFYHQYAHFEPLAKKANLFIKKPNCERDNYIRALKLSRPNEINKVLFHDADKSIIGELSLGRFSNIR